MTWDYGVKQTSLIRGNVQRPGVDDAFKVEQS